MNNPPLHLFRFLKEITLLNSKATLVKYANGSTSYDVLFIGSKILPRKLKKRIRKLIS